MTQAIGFAKAAAKGGKSSGGIVGAIVDAVAGGDNCGTGTSGGKRGFQPGNKCGGKRNADVVAKQKAHTAAKNAAKGHLTKARKAGATLSAEGRRAVKVAAAAGRELRAAREAHKATQRDTRNAKRRETRAAAKAAGTTKATTSKAADPKAEAAKRLEQARAETTTKTTIANRVAESVKESAKIKAERAAANIGALAVGAKAGAFDRAKIGAEVDRIAKGSSKAELFAAAKAAGVDAKGITTKQAMAARLKEHAESGIPKPASATTPTPAATASTPKATPTPAPRAATPGRNTPERSKLAGDLARARASRDREAVQDLDSRREGARKAAGDARGAKADPKVANRIDRAFEKLDRKGDNLVSLDQLRRELPDVPRPVFDATLRQLRADRKFAAETHEGLTKAPTKSQRRASIREGGQRLTYLARR